MSEKFNSGYGGYTCDHYTCSKLLWVGWGGKDSPDRRIYCYESTAESVKEKGNYAYCSLKCLTYHQIRHARD